MLLHILFSRGMCHDNGKKIYSIWIWTPFNFISMHHGEFMDLSDSVDVNF